MHGRKTIAVIGGGSTGLTAARIACQRGANVLLFVGDKGDYSSLCIDAGCMPSKALFEPIDAMHHAKRHGWLRVEPVHPDRYLGQVVRWKDEQIAEFRDYRQQEIRKLAADRFQIINAKASFLSDHELVSEGQRYRFDAAIIASGSETNLPKIAGLDLSWDGVWTSDEILHNIRIPKSLAVIGAGPIGVEFSLRYARLGSEVTLLSRSGLLPDYPARFGERLASIYQREALRVLTHRQVARISRSASGEFEIETDGAEKLPSATAEKILLATGRHPALDELGLESLGMPRNEKGALDIDDDMRIKGRKHIFAAGDVAGLRMVVHHAHIEAGIAAENACSDGDRKWTKRSNIQIVFADPQFAFAGMLPADALKAGHELISASAESRDVGMLHLAGDDFGFGEISADVKTSELVNAGLLCADASNLIHLPAYAIDHRHTIHQLEDAEFYHPTKIEIISEIGDQLCRKFGGHPFARARE
jgi:pyruvate/2-oxoglutarate dehydrogenase complex dihydrolipoamide dehydrogenase (E3) component